MQSKTEFHSVRIIILTLYKYKMPAGGATIELPENIKLMHAVINPKCSDGCFMYSVMLGLIKVKGCKHANSPRAITAMFKQQNKKANFTDFENYVPFNVANYERFVRQNPDIILKVWVLTGLISCPIKLVFAPTSPPLTGKVVNLLFLFNPDDVNDTGHYACIKTINRMLAHVGVDSNKGKALCPFCNHVYENRREYEACPRCHIPVPQDDAKFDEDLPVPEVFVCVRSASQSSLIERSLSTTQTSVP